MPPVTSRYTFADFLQRLERSPVAHMSPLYHEHRLLFANRPDMLAKAIYAVSWERGLALLQAAYYTQPVTADCYRTLLARMLRHNRHVERSGAGALVSWQAAMQVLNEAVRTHGTSLPTRVTVSALRLLAPHRQWQTAMDILKLSQVNGQLTKPMLLDAAHACANEAAWSQALFLLQHLHKQDPPLLHDAIQSMRPPGTTALTAANAAQALLPSASQDNAAPTPAQQHILTVLNSVVAAVPPSVALRDRLCNSYLTHLLASTTLRPEVKVRRATAAMAQLPWAAALQLLSDLSEPTLLTDREWAQAQETALLSDGGRHRGGEEGAGDSYSDSVASAEAHRNGKGKKKGMRKKKMKALKAKPQETKSETHVHEEGEGRDAGCAPSRGAEGNAPAGASPNIPRSSSDAALTPATAALFSRLQLLRASPLTSAAMIAVMVEKLPTPQMAVAFIRSCAEQLSQAGPPASSSSSFSNTFSSLPNAAGAAFVGAAAATRHPVVVHALLRNCARHPDGWAIAADVLLEHSGAQVATPTELISALVLQLRRAKQVSLVVRLLQEHIVPSGSVLTPSAWEAVLECALAHNRALQLRGAVGDGARGSRGSGPRQPPLHHGETVNASRLAGVHWVSALSWVLARQAAPREARIQQTGTGPSLGATPRHPTAHVALEQPLSPKMLSLLINVCVQGGSPQGALHAMGYARRVDKTELPHTAQIRALLYCMQYERPFEAEAIVAQVAKKEGEAAAQPLQHLLKLMGECKRGDDSE